MLLSRGLLLLLSRLECHAECRAAVISVVLGRVAAPSTSAARGANGECGFGKKK